MAVLPTCYQPSLHATTCKYGIHNENSLRNSKLCYQPQFLRYHTFSSEVVEPLRRNGSTSSLLLGKGVDTSEIVQKISNFFANFIPFDSKKLQGGNNPP